MSGKGKDDIARDLYLNSGHSGGGKPYLSPGARKEKLLARSYARAAERASLPYAELRVASAFSFLDGASLPEDLVARAAELGLPAIALADRNGVSGAPRFYKAARAAGLRALVGAEVVLGDPPDTRLTLLVESPAGYKNLCKLLTAAARGKAKGAAAASWEEIAEFSVRAAPAHRRRRGAARGGAAGRRCRRRSPHARPIDARASGAPVPGTRSRRAPAPRPARGGAPQPGTGRSRRAASPAARRHQRRALRPVRGQVTARHPDGHPRIT